MKLRRALAVAAATAVIAPAALFAAPVAYATDDETSASPSATDSPAATPGESGAGVETPPAETPPAETEDSKPEDTGPGDEAPEPGDPAAVPGEEESESATPTPSGSVTATTSTEPTATPSTEAPGGPFECPEDGELTFDKNLRTSLTGLPERIVAGSGYHGFELNVSNKGKNTYKRVDLGVFAGQVDETTWEEDSSHLTLQYQDPTSGKWIDISLDGDDDGAGYLGYTDVQARESFSIDLRLSVDKTAPSGLGYALSIGLYADDQGNCVIADDDAYYEFDIVKAGSDAGDPNEATPQTGGTKPIPAKPVGDTEIKPEGHLAQTGSSSMVPAIGMAGGIAVVAGAGVMFAVKRRRTTGGDAA